MSALIDTTSGRFSGYASLFGVTDSAGDQVMRGAFTASLTRRHAAGVRMLWQHDPAKPVGVWESLREDARGLFVTGRLALDTRLGRDASALIAQGALNGLSIGFKAVTASGRKGSGLRRLHAVDLWEISLVTFPALEGACIAPPARFAERLVAAASLLSTP